jgi:hypothetical protein
VRLTVRLPPTRTPSCAPPPGQLLNLLNGGEVVDILPSFSAFDRVFPPEGELPLDAKGDGPKKLTQARGASHPCCVVRSLGRWGVKCGLLVALVSDPSLLPPPRLPPSLTSLPGPFAWWLFALCDCVSSDHGY